VKLVDTHGAGDAFIGALAARWASGVPIAEVVRFANAAAALFDSTPADQKNAEQKTNNFCLLPFAFCLFRLDAKAQVRVIVAEPSFSCTQGLAGDPTVM
jgi:hypothetical protein